MRIFEIRHQLTKFNEDVMLFKLTVSNRDHLLYNLLNKSTFFARCIFQDVGRRVEEDKSCTYVAIVLKYIYIYIFFIFYEWKTRKKITRKYLRREGSSSGLEYPTWKSIAKMINARKKIIVLHFIAQLLKYFVSTLNLKWAVEHLAIRFILVLISKHSIHKCRSIYFFFFLEG